MSDKRTARSSTAVDKDEADVYELGYDLDETIVADSPARLKAVGNHLRALHPRLGAREGDDGDRTCRTRSQATRHRRPPRRCARRRRAPEGHRTRRVRAIEERFYGRTAQTIVFRRPRMTVICRSWPTPEPRPTCRRRKSACKAADSPCATHGSPRTGEGVHRACHGLALEFTRLPRDGTREYAFLAGVFPTNRPVAPEDPK